MDPCDLSLAEASNLIRTGMLTPIKLLESTLKRIKKLENRIQAWVSIDYENSLETAYTYTKELEEGITRGYLHGIPIGVKDIFYTKDIKTTAGSKILANFIPKYDATTIKRLKQSGAIILGKTHTTEFAYSDAPPTRNPWNTDYTPGGSSSGSAAAVSSGMCVTALGTQTGGSTIRPAAFCGLVGFKPTYGRISRYGVIPRAWSMDHVGIISRKVEDAAIMLEVLAGFDKKDPTTLVKTVPEYSKKLNLVKTPHIALFPDFYVRKAHAEIKNNIKTVLDILVNEGAKISELPLPKYFSIVQAAQNIIGTTECAAYHENMFMTNKMDYRPKIRGLIASGLITPASTYLKAQRIRNYFIRHLGEFLKKYDCIITPSSVTPPLYGIDNTGSSAFNSPWSFCGFPAITIPSGLTENGLPMGIQLVSSPYMEEKILKIAQWCEKILNFTNTPKILSQK